MEHKADRPHYPHRSSGRFLDGFLVGLILGFGLALLITTKKGRKMLKMLTDEGLDSVSELKKRLDNIELALDEDDQDEEYIVEEVEEDAEIEDNVSDIKPSRIEVSQKTPKKRLFKGISRKN